MSHFSPMSLPVTVCSKIQWLPGTSPDIYYMTKFSDCVSLSICGELSVLLLYVCLSLNFLFLQAHWDYMATDYACLKMFPRAKILICWDLLGAFSVLKNYLENSIKQRFRFRSLGLGPKVISNKLPWGANFTSSSITSCYKAVENTRKGNWCRHLLVTVSGVLWHLGYENFHHG